MSCVQMDYHEVNESKIFDFRQCLGLSVSVAILGASLMTSLPFLWFASPFLAVCGGTFAV